jgi:VanZ family protein
MTAIYKAAFVTALSAIYLLAVLPGDSLPGVQLWDKLQHAAAFFLLALLMGRAWPRSSLWRLRLPSLFAYGVMIEMSQSMLSYREASLHDLVANACGLLLYVVLATAVGEFIARFSNRGRA